MFVASPTPRYSVGLSRPLWFVDRRNVMSATTIGIGTRFSVGATVPDFANADVLHVLHVLSYQSGTARVQINKHAYQPI